MTLTPRPYQIEGRDFLASRRFALLADEMRVGKTPQAILAAEKIGVEHALVVCPAIACDHWYGEWNKWHGTGPLPSVQIRSYDRAKREADALCSQQWDLVIVDECHFAKNPDAARTKLIYGKDGLGWCSERMWALSGTPAPKHAGELWPMLHAFGACGMKYGDFLRRYCVLQPFTLRVIGTKEKMIPELRAMLATIMLRRTRKQVAPDMPDIGFEFLTVNIDKDLSAFDGLNDDQLLNFTEFNTTYDREDRREVALAKVPSLVDEIVFAIENGLLKQTVVFGWHKEPLYLLTQALSDCGVSVGVMTGDASQVRRTRIQQDFREGKLQVICANILAAGTAIDLSAASHGYFLELDWVSGNNAQAANRLVSMDKKEPVTFDVVTMPGSVDDRIQKVLLTRVQQLCKLY